VPVEALHLDSGVLPHEHVDAPQLQSRPRLRHAEGQAPVAASDVEDAAGSRQELGEMARENADSPRKHEPSVDGSREAQCRGIPRRLRKKLKKIV
jgi:hypothetical protein